MIQFLDPVTYIITACKAHAQFLPDAIKSVLGQSHCDIRLIVFLDWHDSLNEIVELMGPGSSGNVLYLTANRVVGKSMGFNIAFRHARTRYLCFLDADDLVHPEKTRAQVQFLKENPHYSHCGTSYWHQSANGNSVHVNMEQMGLREIFRAPLFLYSSLMIDLERVNFTGLDEGLQVAMDYKLSHELVKSSSGANLPENLTIYRSSFSTIGSDTSRRASQLINHAKILCEAAFSRLPPSQRSQFTVLYSLGLTCADTNSNILASILLEDLGAHSHGFRVSSVKALLDDIYDAVSPRYSNAFTEFSDVFRGLILRGASLLNNLS